ncbi:hypothetical protein F8S13_20790 [Chloroflexia bacterium SDU3-3]|nr:hypothetical protein F8S13_20790 [Chloroflexia bacterium SDU3-3]
MRRAFFPMLCVALVLTACGGAADLTVAVPPNSKVVETTGASTVDTLITSWRNTVPASMTERGIKAESLEQKVYTTTDSLEAVQAYYEAKFKDQNGWTRSMRSPGLDAAQGILIEGYEHSGTSMVVGAIDASKYGGSGVVIYTATGHK